MPQYGTFAHARAQARVCNLDMKYNKAPDCVLRPKFETVNLAVFFFVCGGEGYPVIPPDMCPLNYGSATPAELIGFTYVLLTTRSAVLYIPDTQDFYFGGCWGMMQQYSQI